MATWRTDDRIFAQYYIARESTLVLELRMGIIRRLCRVLVALTLMAFVFVYLIWMSAIWLAAAAATLSGACALYALLPFYVLVDSARREVRMRRGLRKLFPHPRAIPFDQVENIVIWDAYRYSIDNSRAEVRMDLRDGSSEKLDKTMDDDYANHLASSLAERIGVKVKVKTIF